VNGIRGGDSGLTDDDVVRTTRVLCRELEI
jgi:hypothetical protein